MTQPAQIKQFTVNDLLAQVQEKVERFGIDLDDLPVPSVYAWWHPQKNAYQNFRYGEAHPWEPDTFVFAMFRDDDEIRVYTIAGPTADPKLPGLKRYVLSKRNQAYEIEILMLDGYVQTIADEWTVVAENMTTADAERERIVDFLRKKGWGVAADAVDALEHLEDDDEPEPEPAPVPNGAPQPEQPS